MKEYQRHVETLTRARLSRTSLLSFGGHRLVTLQRQLRDFRFLAQRRCIRLSGDHGEDHSWPQLATAELPMPTVKLSRRFGGTLEDTV